MLDPFKVLELAYLLWFWLHFSHESVGELLELLNVQVVEVCQAIVIHGILIGLRFSQAFLILGTLTFLMIVHREWRFACL